MITTTLCIELTIDNNVDIIMFYEFKNSKMTRFDRELTL